MFILHIEKLNINSLNKLKLINSKKIKLGYRYVKEIKRWKTADLNIFINTADLRKNI